MAIQSLNLGTSMPVSVTRPRDSSEWTDPRTNWKTIDIIHELGSELKSVSQSRQYTIDPSERPTVLSVNTVVLTESVAE